MSTEADILSGTSRQKGNSGVSPTLIQFWNDNHEWGDFKKLEGVTSFSRPTIRDAFNGFATTEVAEKITQFYISKVKK